MFQSRRALLYQANSFLRSNPLHRNTYASIPNRNQGPTTPEDLTKLYKPPEESQVYRKAAGGLDGGASTYGGTGAMNAGNGGERWREDGAGTYEEPRETAESVAQTARVAAAGAVETGLKLGKMAKQTADGLWEAVEKTAENARDSVAEDVDEGGRRRAQTAADDIIEEQRSDKFVDDLRRRGGGYDLKDRW